MLIENVTFPEAVERVAERAGIKLPAAWGGEHDDVRAKERTLLHRIHEITVQFFSSQLGRTAEGRAARAYLTDRGLSDATLAHFRLGYAPADGEALARRLSEAGFTADSMEASGVVVQGRAGGRPLDRFRRRIIFPIANESGKVVAFAGRALGEEQPKYLNSPETPIYTKSRILYHLHKAGPAIRKLETAILVEGYMDCIALAAAGIEHVVASCGTSLTEAQIRLLGRYARRIVVNYDPDSAGMTATERSLGLLLEEGFEIKVLTLPDGLDPDSYVRQRGISSYIERLEKAPAYLDYLTDRAIAAHDLTLPEGKVRAANTLLPYLARVANPLLRDEMANRVAERLRLDNPLFRAEIKRAAKTGTGKVEEGRAQARIEASPAEQELLAGFLDNAGLAAEFLEPLVDEGNCHGLPTESIFKKFLSGYRERGSVDFAALEATFELGERRFIAELQFANRPAPDRAQMLASLSALRRRRMERERASLQNAIERAEREKDRESLDRLIEAKIEITKELAQLRRA
jgi:DNA primase